MVLLFKAYVDGVLHYSLPVLQKLPPTSRKQLDAARNNCLRICLGLPRGSSCLGTVAEAGCLPLDVIRLQETVRIHLRHRMHAKAHILTRVIENGNSSFGQTLRTLHLSIPSQAPNSMPSNFPPWTLSPLHIRCNIPGIDSKKNMRQSILLQLTLGHINRLYSGTNQIFTDGSCTLERSSSGIFISSTGQTISHCLERATSSMSAELHAIK